MTLTGHQEKGDSDFFFVNLQSWGLKQSLSGKAKDKGLRKDFAVEDHTSVAILIKLN